MARYSNCVVICEDEGCLHEPCSGTGGGKAQQPLPLFFTLVRINGEQSDTKLDFPLALCLTHYQLKRGGHVVKKNITREHKMIHRARKRCGLSQQQVATLISIQIRQYQRLEYGESDVQKLGMRAGLALCIVLELDPYDLIFGAHPETIEDLRARRPAKGNLKKRHKS